MSRPIGLVYSRDAETFPETGVNFSTEDPFNSHTPNIYIPFFTLIEFISYMGWIKVQKYFYSVNSTLSYTSTAESPATQMELQGCRMLWHWASSYSHFSIVDLIQNQK